MTQYQRYMARSENFTIMARLSASRRWRAIYMARARMIRQLAEEMDILEAIAEYADSEALK